MKVFTMACLMSLSFTCFAAPGQPTFGFGDNQGMMDFVVKSANDYIAQHSPTAGGKVETPCDMDFAQPTIVTCDGTLNSSSTEPQSSFSCIAKFIVGEDGMHTLMGDVSCQAK